MALRIRRRDLFKAAAGFAAGGTVNPRILANSPGRMQVALQPLSLQPGILRFLKQIGVDNLYVHMPTIPGYAKYGYLKDDDLSRVKLHVADYGLTINALILNNLAKTNLLLGRPGWELELDNICRTIECMGRGAVGIMLYNMLVSRVLADYTIHALPGHSSKPNGRGGVGLKTFDDHEALAANDNPVGEVTAAETWERIERFLKRCVPVAEQAKVRLALHPDDPPVERFWGATQVLNSLEGMNRYLALAPSPVNGVDFCQGTVQEAGIDVIESLRTWGRQNKLVTVELRGVRGKIPHYDETFMDDGDLDLTKVVRALRQIGYMGDIQGRTRSGVSGR